MRRGPEFRVGTSGYSYRDWPGRFYPPDLPTSRWLDFYAQRFDTVEINNSFYRLPRAEVFARWAETVPDDFVFAVKYSRFATHLKRLLDPAEPIERFTGVATALGRKAGPVLVQLPPNWRAEPGRLDEFLSLVPRTFRWAVEVRDDRWLCDEVYDVLRTHRTPLVFHDLLDRHPRPVTGDFVYIRFHGIDYGGHYSPQALSAEADRIASYLRDGLDVYAYFNNDKLAAAITDATRLRDYVARRRHCERPPAVQAARV